MHSIEERMIARDNKEFSKSDQIRHDLATKGIALMDIGKETVWRPCVPMQQNQSAESAQSEETGLPVRQTNPRSTENAPANPPPAENAPANPPAENARSVSPGEK